MDGNTIKDLAVQDGGAFTDFKGKRAGLTHISLHRRCLTAQGSRASASCPGSLGSEYLLPRRGYVHIYLVCQRPQIIWAQPLRGRRCSASEPRVARKASQPWAVRRNAFGIKKDLHSKKDSHVPRGCLPTRVFRGWIEFPGKKNSIQRTTPHLFAGLLPACRCS